MELQPIVGSACAHCHDKILVDVDGKNCKRCGLAVHRRCSRAHREACTGKPALAHVAHDYDEVAQFDWTPRAIGIAAVATFVATFGLAMVTMAPAAPESGAAEQAPAPAVSPVKTRVGYGALAVGVLGLAGGLAFERSRQSQSSQSSRPGRAG